MVNDNLRQRRKDWDKERAERPDAAPPEWTYTIEHNLAMFNVVGTDKKTRARIIASCYEREDAERIMALYAHPEDAPEGPWEILHHYEHGSAVPDQFDVTRHHGKTFTWAEAIAVRDALNRLANDS